MLTNAALEDRYWNGSTVLRRILSPKADEWRQRGPLTSISETDGEAIRRLMNLGEMILEFRTELLSATSDEETGDGPPVRLQAAQEVNSIADQLRYFATHLDSLGRELGSVTAQLGERR
jgi:hypothetical protein